MTDPNEKLMSEIMEILQTKKILTQNEANKIGIKIISGQIKSEDWKLAVELSMDKRNHNG
jgi:hypothetical protein